MAENTPRHLADPDLERARAWWKDYGRPIVGGVVVALLGVTGYNYWQNQQQHRGEQASALYEQLRAHIDAGGHADAETGADSDSDSDSDSESDSESESGVDIETVAQLAGELMLDYASTPYAPHAAFSLAKIAVDGGDLERAAGALRWVVENADETRVVHVARLRLAAIYLAQNRAADAEALLQTGDPGQFAARYHELRGDAAFAQGDSARARGEWESGLQFLRRGDPARVLLQMKLDNFGQ